MLHRKTLFQKVKQNFAILESFETPFHSWKFIWNSLHWVIPHYPRKACWSLMKYKLYTVSCIVYWWIIYSKFIIIKQYVNETRESVLADTRSYKLWDLKNEDLLNWMNLWIAQCGKTLRTDLAWASHSHILLNCSWSFQSWQDFLLELFILFSYFICMYVYVLMYVCAHVGSSPCMCVEVRGQPQLYYPSPLRKPKPASPGILLPLLPQLWDYGHMPPVSWVVFIEYCIEVFLFGYWGR